jgi:hypothetical protein
MIELHQFAATPAGRILRQRREIRACWGWAMPTFRLIDGGKASAIVLHIFLANAVEKIDHEGKILILIGVGRAASRSSINDEQIERYHRR